MNDAEIIAWLKKIYNNLGGSSGPAFKMYGLDGATWRAVKVNASGELVVYLA